MREKIILCDISGGLAIVGNLAPAELGQAVDTTLYTTGAIGPVTWRDSMPDGRAAIPPPLSFIDNENGTATLSGTRSIWFPRDTPPRPLVAADSVGQTAQILIDWATGPDYMLYIDGASGGTVDAGSIADFNFTAIWRFSGFTATWSLTDASDGLSLTDNGDNTATLHVAMPSGSWPSGPPLTGQLIAKCAQGPGLPDISAPEPLQLYYTPGKP